MKINNKNQSTNQQQLADNLEKQYFHFNGPIGRDKVKGTEVGTKKYVKHIFSLLSASSFKNLITFL